MTTLNRPFELMARRRVSIWMNNFERFLILLEDSVFVNHQHGSLRPLDATMTFELIVAANERHLDSLRNEFYTLMHTMTMNDVTAQCLAKHFCDMVNEYLEFYVGTVIRKIEDNALKTPFLKKIQDELLEILRPQQRNFLSIG